MRGAPVTRAGAARRLRPPVAVRRGARIARIRAVATRPIVLKLGGELLERLERVDAIARLIVRASRKRPLAVVHGGGREIDLALVQQSIPKHQVDGLRITDAATLSVVVAVLAGSINTRLVAAINAAGGRAVGLTGADAGVGHVTAAPPHRATNGETVDLGLVGEPLAGEDTPLVDLLCSHGYVPVIACIGASRDGRLFNVNADTLAGSLAVRSRASRLVIAGATAGVLDGQGLTIAALDGSGIDGVVGSGTASAGMVAKLRACRLAAEAGVADVAIADGRDVARLGRLLTGRPTADGPWTRILPNVTGN
jgi:acetylglutamate kinase